MRAAHRLLVVALLLLLCVLPAGADWRGHHRPRGARAGFGASWGYGSYGGYGSVFSPAPFVPGPFVPGPFVGYGAGYGLGYGYYPPHYPPYPYPAPMVQHPQYVTVIAEATHDWRNWSPTTKVIVGPVTSGSDVRTIGMGLPQWAAVNSEPLGDVARRYRLLAGKKALEIRSDRQVVLRSPSP